MTCLGSIVTGLENEFGGSVQSSTVPASDDLHHEYHQRRDERHKRRQSQMARGWSVVACEEESCIHGERGGPCNAPCQQRC